MAYLESTDFKLRQILIDYSKGESLAVVEDTIRQHVDGEKNGYKLYNKIYGYRNGNNNPEEIHPLTIEFLRLYGIDPSDDEFSLLVSLSLYQMITRLKGRHGHLDKLHSIIHQVHEPKKWTKTIILTILFCTGIGLFLYFYPHLFWMFIDWFMQAFPQFVKWLCVIFTEVRSVAIIGIAWQSSVLIYTWYNTFKYGPNPSPDSLRSLAFKTLGIAMNISGNVLMYLAHGALGPIAAVLFIACSFMDVLETIYLLFVKYESPQIDFSESVRHAHLKFKSRQINLETPLTAELSARNIRLDNMRERDLNILWIKLAATALITISIILWCTMPSGIVLSLCFLVFGLLVNLAKDLIIKRITDRYAESLQKGLRVVYKNESKELSEARDKFASFFMEETNGQENEEITPILRTRWEQLREKSPFILAEAKEAFHNAKNDVKQAFKLGRSGRNHPFFTPPASTTTEHSLDLACNL